MNQPDPDGKKMDVAPPAMGVGELARRTGLTVRTLHHYEAIGLMTPTARTEAGHRRYSDADLGRLQQIVALRAVGLSLSAVGALLDGDVDPLQPIERLRAHLTEQVGRAQHLIDRLDAIAAYYRGAGAVSADDLIQLIRLTTMFEKHYTPEQLDQLKQRRVEVGEARIEEVQKEWATLFDALRAHMEQGDDPASPPVQELARRAATLVAEFTGGDAGIRGALNEAYKEERQAMHQAWGIDEELGAYYGKVMGALKGPTT